MASSHTLHVGLIQGSDHFLVKTNMYRLSYLQSWVLGPSGHHQVWMCMFSRTQLTWMCNCVSDCTEANTDAGSLSRVPAASAGCHHQKHACRCGGQEVGYTGQCNNGEYHCAGLHYSRYAGVYGLISKPYYLCIALSSLLSFIWLPDPMGEPTHLLKTEALNDGNFITTRFVTVSYSCVHILTCGKYTTRTLLPYYCLSCKL